MRKLLATAVLAALSMSAHAADLNGTATSNANGVATSGAVNSGVQLDNTFTSPGTTTVHNVPGAPSIGLYGNFNGDSCFVSAGVSGSGMGFSFGVGAPIKDGDCNKRATVRLEMSMAANMATSDPTVAIALQRAALRSLCRIDGNKDDLVAEGFDCGDKRDSSSRAASIPRGDAVAVLPGVDGTLGG